MSTPPTVTDSTIIATVKKDWTWLTSHIILLIIVVGLMVGAVYFVDSIVARHDAENSSKYSAILAEQVTQTKNLQNQLTADEAASAQRDVQYQAIISSLAQNIQKRDANAKKQQTTDAGLDVAGTASRLAEQTEATSGEITTSGNNVVLDLPIARRVVVDLDALPAAKADLDDAQKQLEAQNVLTADAIKDASDAKKVIAAQTLTLADSTKSCNAQISTLKANARKSKIKIFFVGFVSGFISGVTAHAW